MFDPVWECDLAERFWGTRAYRVSFFWGRSRDGDWRSKWNGKRGVVIGRWGNDT